MSDKDLYKQYCETEGAKIPLFMQYWWMEAVCQDKTWDVAIARDGDAILGVMPYLYGRKMGMTYILQPQLTQYSGPFYCYPDGLNEQQRLEFEKDVARKLIAQIEERRPAIFLQHFSPQVANWLPFYWTGYSQTTRYTYRLDDISDPQRLFDSFDREKRQRKIRRYEDCTSVRYDMSPAEFADLHACYWHDKGKRDLLRKDLIEHVCSTAVARGNGVIASLHDADGKLLVARFVAYDSRCAYALMSAYKVDTHRSGHNETLLWALLQYLSDKTKSFDFEGSMDEGIEYFYRSFGAHQTPYFEISKYRNSLVRWLMKLKK